jgi:acetylornithine deacetylase
MSLPGLFEMCARLVAEPSVSCASPAHDQGNRGVIDQLAGWCSDLGADVEVRPLDGAPGKANLVARFGAATATDRDGGLVLAGHTDTVPWDAGRWREDPFALRDEGTRWVGLGICDMKGFFPLALSALEPLLGNGGSRRLATPVTLLATADEESTMAGARQLVASGTPRARYAIIGEPTDLRPVYAHKGMMMLSIRLHGRSGHSSNPDLGVSALDAMHAVMTELLVFRTELAARFRHPGFEVQVPTMNLGCLHAGDSPNRICGAAELQIDLRLVPGMDNDETVRALAARIRPVAERHGVHCHVDHLFPPLAAFETAPDSDFVRSCEALSGQRAGTVAFGTEGPYLQALGMETVVLGPGHIDQAHQPDEFLRVDRIAPTVELLRGLIVERCSRR